MLLCLLLCALPARGFLLGSCPRKDPPPGVVVVHPGSSVALSCSGWVMVDGVRVNVTTATPTTHHNDVTATGESPATATTHHNDVITATGESPAPAATQRSDGVLRPTVTHTVDDNTGVTGALHTADHTEQLEQHQTLPPSDEYDWKAGDDDDDDDDDDDHDEHKEEKGEAFRVTRAVRRSRAQWRRNGRLVTGGGGGARLQFGRRGSILALTAVAVTDTGAYTCHRHRHNFSVKVHVAGPPEQPILQCYKRSPSSKIRCDWTPQRPVSAHTSCSLLLYKGQGVDPPLRTECSYSSRLSRWWCAAGHSEDEHRVNHIALMCVSSLTGSRLSPMLEFSPLGILKPDPPSAVSVTQVEGQERRLEVTWGPPLTWKGKDHFYSLQYELMYRPLQSTMDTVVQMGGETVYWQVMKKNMSYSITDAMPGEDYAVQIRTKDEWDGLWSDWSPALYTHTWTDQTSNTDDLPITMYPFYPESESEGSGIPAEAVFKGGKPSDRTEVVWYHMLLAASSCVVLLVALAAYTIRRVGLVQPCFLHKPPSSTFSATSSRPQGAMSPPCYKHTLPGQEEQQERGGGGEEEEEEEGGGEEEDEEEEVTEETKVLHFDNSSYFLVHT